MCRLSDDMVDPVLAGGWSSLQLRAPAKDIHGGYATPGTRGSRRTANAALSPGRVGVYARSGPWQSIAC